VADITYFRLAVGFNLEATIRKAVATRIANHLAGADLVIKSGRRSLGGGFIRHLLRAQAEPDLAVTRREFHFQTGNAEV